MTAQPTLTSLLTRRTARAGRTGRTATRTRAGAAAAGAAVAVLLAAALAVGVLGPDRAVQAAAFLALLGLACAAAAAAAALTVLRRRLGELRHLPDLGRRFVTHHDRAHVTAVREEGDHLVVDVASEQVQTVVLDEAGAPDHVGEEHVATSQWRMPTGRLSQDERGRVRRLLAADPEVNVVAEGVVGLAGPVEQSWQLRTANGLVLRAKGRGAGR
ncbi:hypothetical protein RDV89_04675 [Nocardioides zeae]|uniref:Uncharacterized protein n=1 Tax=Nocardioides imazamoxiresistens TaxID=3231893 RepID=A0ABU3PU15_9ACTN|nr:hypothetical protein [Nocardioides zeae]MDT9592347.1 hypothetical protein [Nocardioides zeae]